LLGFVLAGSIPVERAFGTPGLRYAMFTAVSERDVFVMQNLVFLYACVFVVLNILVDLTIAWLDPRIRYQCLRSSRTPAMRCCSLGELTSARCRGESRAG